MWKKILASIGVASLIMLMAQMPVKPVDGNGNEQMLGAPGRRVLYPLQVVNTSTTTFTLNTIKVVTLFCSNQSGSAVTLNIGDDWTAFYPDVSIPPNSVNMLVAQSGLTFRDGLYMVAGTTNSIYCQVEGVE